MFVGCVRVLFAYFVIAILGLHLFGFVAWATRPSKCAYHEFWVPGSTGPMIRDWDCFWEIRRVVLVNGFWCVFVCLEIEVFVCELCLGVCVCCLRILRLQFVFAFVWFCRFGDKTRQMCLS